jgi:hypothetical protein
MNAAARSPLFFAASAIANPPAPSDLVGAIMDATSPTARMAAIMALHRHGVAEGVRLSTEAVRALAGE